MGWVSRISRVPSRCSSASSRMVEAGTKIMSSQGNAVKRLWVEASVVVPNGVKK